MWKIVCLSIIVIVSLVACASEPEGPAYTVVDEGSLSAGQPIPAPEGEVILTITGNIGVSNVPGADGNQVEMDLATLESLRLVEYTVLDHQATGETASFRGILISDLLDVLAVPAEATTFHATALDDYSIDIPIEDFRDYAVILASQMNEAYIPVTNFGPIRVIYPYHVHPDLEGPVYDPRWIWNVATIEVR